MRHVTLTDAQSGLICKAIHQLMDDAEQCRREQTIAKVRDAMQERITECLDVLRAIDEGCYAGSNERDGCNCCHGVTGSRIVGRRGSASQRRPAPGV